MTESGFRLELARRLHDGLAQELAALGYSLDGLIADPELPQRLRRDLRSIRISLTSLTEDFRNELFLLRNVDRVELGRALRQILRALETELDLDYPKFSEEVEDGLSRAILEIARNCIKHGRATRFALSWLVTVDVLTMTLSDNGVGGLSMKERSLGMKGIGEYIDRIGGTMKVFSDGDGTRYTLMIPLARK